ncbi:Carbonic anhydrase 3 like protein [Argiope bruennichi]|uniref:carbonic anhydrase n=1 Tax=Argiope bruennichi TaxID=94029 RepID=A0A8T0ERW0_ARGBR|nr:Carbonic anhydrase 3 like protein [Argiope bruennichi]
MLQVFLICALFFTKDVLTQECEADDQYPWSYHGPDNGPYYWDDNYPDCGKKDQSPIEINKKDILNLDLPQLQYSGFDTPISKATVLNLGWTVLIIPEDDVNRYITWGKNTFTLAEIHFHFGSEGDPGAEHVIDDIRYEMEMHYVTHKENDPNAVAVVAALMELDTFMTLYSVGKDDASDSCLMGPNYRPEQSLDHRPIFSSK